MRYSVYLFILFALTTLSCTSTHDSSRLEASYTLVDDLGRSVAIPVNPKRIVSLTPSVTELIYTFADTAKLAGRSIWCDYPLAVKKVPALNSYPLDVEGLVRLKPDLVLVKKGMITAQELDKLEQLNLAVFVQKYDLLHEIYASARTLVKITKGDSIQCEKWLKAIQTYPVKNHTQKKKTCLAVTSVLPVYVFGKTTFVSELIGLAGGENCIESTQNAYPAVDVEYILRANPDVFLFNSKEQQHLFFETYPVLKKCGGYLNGRLYVIDDSVMSRPGIRLPELKDSLVSIFEK